MRYYAVGTKEKKAKGEDGGTTVETVSVVVPPEKLPNTRVGAVNEAERIFSPKSMSLTGVFPLVNDRNNYGEVMVKRTKQQRQAGTWKEVKKKKK